MEAQHPLLRAVSGGSGGMTGIQARHLPCGQWGMLAQVLQAPGATSGRHLSVLLALDTIARLPHVTQAPAGSSRNRRDINTGRRAGIQPLEWVSLQCGDLGR
jgi:hypothetical protein